MLLLLFFLFEMRLYKHALAVRLFFAGDFLLKSMLFRLVKMLFGCLRYKRILFFLGSSGTAAVVEAGGVFALTVSERR